MNVEPMHAELGYANTRMGLYAITRAVSQHKRTTGTRTNVKEFKFTINEQTSPTRPMASNTGRATIWGWLEVVSHWSGYKSQDDTGMSGQQR